MSRSSSVTPQDLHTPMVTVNHSASTLHVRAVAAESGNRPLPGQSFSPAVAESFALVERSQAVEIEALQRMASPGGWLMTREVTRGR